MKNLNRIQLGGLRAVEAAGRLGSLRAAASELGVTVGAVSQRVQKAEQQLGQVLFERRPHGLVPTELGASVLERLAAGMAELSAAVALAGRGGGNAITVSVAPVLAGKWLVWRLSRFHDAHPGIRVRVDANSSLVDANAPDIDLCIRIGGGEPRGMEIEKIIDQRVFPVCSPALAERLRTPSDLAAVPIIRDLHAMFPWDVWLAPNDLDAAMLGAGPEYSDASLCIDAAVAGQGVFLAWDTLANDAIAGGRLVAPFPGRVKTGFSYWFAIPRAARATKAAAIFRQWIRQELEATLDMEP